MNSEDLENEFGNFSLDQSKAITELLLRVMIANQAKITNILDPSKSEEQYLKEFKADLKTPDLERFTTIAHRSSN